MTQEQAKLNSQLPNVPFINITPLYCIITDADEISLQDQVTLSRFSEEQIAFLGEHDRFFQHLRLYKPEGLLWERSTLPWEGFLNLTNEFMAIAGERNIEYAEDEVVRTKFEKVPSLFKCMAPLAIRLRALQLFRRGRLVAGDSLFYFPPPFDVRFTLRCIDMSPDYQAMEQYKLHYELNLSDVPDFLRFLITFYEASEKTMNYPEIDVAISRYCRETAQHGGVIDLMISLESLLVPEEEGIAFKLSQRVANLLGEDADSRKKLFKQVRDFYGLRSKTVHGATKKQKEANVEAQLDELRELTRKSILAVMALASEFGMGPDWPHLLNDMCLDDDHRRSLQAKASCLSCFSKG
jgi:hypothetical protein